jgi:hypothetical protein
MTAIECSKGCSCIIHGSHVTHSQNIYMQFLKVVIWTQLSSWTIRIEFLATIPSYLSWGWLADLYASNLYASNLYASNVLLEYIREDKSAYCWSRFIDQQAETSTKPDVSLCFRQTCINWAMIGWIHNLDNVHFLVKMTKYLIPLK